MSQSEKSAYYQALKAVGLEFKKHYREYSAAELKSAYERLQSEGHTMPPVGQPQPVQQPQQAQPAGGQIPRPRQVQGRQAPPVAPRDPNEMAGQRLNTKEKDEPIRTDPDGKIWFQEEVLKPAYPKPRGRRVLKYQDPGVVEKKVINGDYEETFEVAGDMANAVQAEVKVTLPSYQVGIYKDPRFPFKVVTYNGNNGFDLDEVQDFYGGAELVPPDIKRMYVENVLCYDIRTVVRAINTEFRQQQLAGKIR
jgi:hypothetical protein